MPATLQQVEEEEEEEEEEEDEEEYDDVGEGARSKESARQYNE